VTNPLTSFNPTTLVPSPAPAPRRLTGRIPELDGVRGLAILLFLVYHWAAFQPVPHSLGYYLMVPRNLMWSGVDLFFVLSGFLIGGGLIDNRESDNYFRTFYLRRIHRIFPIYYLMIGLFLLGTIVFPTAFLFEGAMPRWPFLLFAQNIGFAIPLAAPWVGVTWSLAVEEQFYFLFPFLVRNLSHKALLITLLACIAFAPLLRTMLLLAGCAPLQIHSLLPCRADALGLGVLAAILVRSEIASDWIRRRRSVVYFCLAALAVSSAALLKWDQPRFVETFGLSLLDGMYFCLLVAVLMAPVAPLIRLFRAGWLRWLGTVSYCVYLIHQPIGFLLFQSAGYSELSIINISTGLLTLLVAALTLSVAQLSWRYLESPLIRRAHRLYQY